MLTIDSHFIRAPLRRAEYFDINIDSLLNELDISRDVFSQDNTRVHVDQYVKLVQRVWEITDDEYWGLTNSPCKPGHFAMCVRYVHPFETLEKMIKESCRFYNSTRFDIHLDFEISEDQAGFYVDLVEADNDVDHYLIEFFLVCFHRFFCWMTNTLIPTNEAHFNYYEPKHVAAYRVLFPGKRIFSSERNGFLFDTKYLSKPIVRTWPEIREFLLTSPAHLMIMQGSDDSYSAKIKNIVQHALNQQQLIPDFDRIAEELGMSSQNLRRKLRAESVSYQVIKDTIRRDLAIDKLVRTDSAILDIAEQLGFAEASSFTRAFKQWTGVSPAEYRLHHSHA